MKCFKSYYLSSLFPADVCRLWKVNVGEVRDRKQNFMRIYCSWHSCIVSDHIRKLYYYLVQIMCAQLCFQAFLYYREVCISVSEGTYLLNNFDNKTYIWRTC